MRSTVFLCLSALLFPALSCAPTDGTADGFEIDYVKIELANGLDVILHEDHSDPIVALATLVHVGSNRERPGKTGFAHFFEHMSFNDSENVPRGANRKMIGELGGLRNGGTWTDGTIYYEVVPKDALEKLMWIDSDRLGFMINTVSEAALENEKQVVKNEKRQRVDNAPYGHTRDVIKKALFPEGHPYSWSVIGSLDDLQNATLDDVRGFYDRYYGANNATLVIAGDIDPDEIRPMLENWFGEIRAGEEVPGLDPMPVKLQQTRSLYHEDNFAKVPELRMVFPTVEQFHPDSYALDTLGRILSEGKRAPLYKVLVEEQKLAPRAAAYHSASELAGTFTIQIRANASVDLDEVRAAVETALARFDENGFLDKDLTRIKALNETDFYGSVSSVLGKAFQLAQYNEYAGDPGYATEQIRRIQSVTREDVIDVFNRYIKDKHHILTSFVPQGEKQQIVEGALQAEVFEELIVQGAEKQVEDDPDFTYARTETKFDRSEPPLGAPPLVDPPEIWSATTDNGMRVLGIAQDELPLVEMTLRIKGGHLLDPPGKGGLAVLLGDMLTEGTKNKTPEELEDAIGQLGATISVRSGRESISISASGLARNFPQILDLVEEILLEPRWDAREFERLELAQQNSIRQREGNPRQVASNAFYKILYGEGHPFSIPTLGTQATVSSITLDDLKSYYAANISPTLASFHVAGDVKRDAVLAALEGIGSRWQKKQVELEQPAAPEPPTDPAVYFIDIPGSKQSVIYIGKLALAGGDADYNDLIYANNRLGSGSSARLFQLLRIEKGYTYGAGSRIPRTAEIAPFVASSSVRANVTLESLRLFREQLRNYSATFTDDDLVTTKNLLIKQATREFETLRDLIAVLEEVSIHDLPLDYIKRDQQELEEMTLADVRSTIARYMDESRMAYVVVGDGATQRERVGDLGYGEAVLLDVHGDPVGGKTVGGGGSGKPHASRAR